MFGRISNNVEQEILKSHQTSALSCLRTKLEKAYFALFTKTTCSTTEAANFISGAELIFHPRPR